MPEIAEDKKIALIESIEHKTKVMHWLVLLITFTLFFVNARVISTVLNYIPSLSIVVLLSIVSVLVAIGFYLSRKISLDAINNLVNYSDKINNLLSSKNKEISERRKAEKALQDAYQLLKKTQEQLIQTGKMAAMGQLAAGISHELNQPLTGIKGFAQIVLKELDGNSPFKRDLEKIAEQANRMDKIIQHVRFFARKSEFQMKELDVNKPIEDSIMFLSEYLRVHNIRVRKSLSKNIPQIQGDHNQLEQVFINLITNAGDAIDSLKNPDGGELFIKTDLSGDRKHVEIIFKDTGFGISKEELNDIFNPFYTTKSPDGGIGLGLSIVYRIIENHQGSIEAESEKGKGTEFRIMLPIINKKENIVARM